MERKRMNKKGWMKVLEAVIAISLLIGVLLYIISTTGVRKDVSYLVYDKEKYILETVSKNDTFRTDILNLDNTNVNKFINKTLAVNWNFETRICTLDNICSANNPIPPPDRNVYSSEIVISSADTKYDPRKFKLFVWVK
jgi:hypothetical protein